MTREFQENTVGVILNELFKDSKELKTQIQFDALIEKYAERIVKLFFIPDVSESIFDKAVKHVQETYCDAHLSTPYMLLGDVVELIKITTGKEVDWNVLAKYSR